MWVHLHDVQICWLYFTLSKIQNFFSPTEQNAAESVTEKFKQFLSKYSFQTVHPIAMNWELDVFSSEALLVKTPDTPECVPAIIDHLKISRVGPSKDKIKYELTGRLSFASFM
jgi:hypothetical protein